MARIETTDHTPSPATGPIPTADGGDAPVAAGTRTQEALGALGGPTDAKPPSTWWGIVKGLVSAALIVLIFGVVIPSFASYSDMADAFSEISTGWILALLGALGCVEILKAASPATIVRDLGLFQSLVAEESAAAIGNTVPGPSATATRFGIYRSWGIGVEDFTLATVMNSIWNNLVLLTMPIVAVLALIASGQDTGTVFWLCVAGVVIAAVGVVVLVLIMRSEHLAWRLGDWTGRVVTRMLSWIRRPPLEGFGDTIVKFRSDTIDTYHRVRIRLTLVVIARYVANYVVLLFSLRATGVDDSVVSAFEVFAAYSVVRLATMIEITPGGIGVNELLYITALTWLTDGAFESQITAGVLLFRGLTYIGPIIIGGLCYVVWSSTDNWKTPEFRSTHEASGERGGRRRRRGLANPQV